MGYNKIDVGLIFFHKICRALFLNRFFSLQYYSFSVTMNFPKTFLFRFYLDFNRINALELPRGKQNTEKF